VRPYIYCVEPPNVAEKIFAHVYGSVCSLAARDKGAQRERSRAIEGILGLLTKAHVCET